MSLAVILISPAVGSFAALVADREGTDRDGRWRGVVFGRSRCDHCGRVLSAGELVPILSYVRSGGRSRCCGRRLRPGLLAAEIAALAIALSAVAVVPAGLVAVSVGLGWALLALVLVDMRLFRLPDWGTLGLVLAGLGVAAVGLTGPAALHAAGAALGYSLFAGIGWAYWRLRGIEGLGLGDAKLMAAAGAWLGPEGLPSVLLIASLAGLLHAGALGLAAGRLDGRTAVPFGPSIALAIWITWLQGPVIAPWEGGL